MVLMVSTHSAVHNSFMLGFIVLRRSNSYWSGVFVYFYIKQVFMWSVKLGVEITGGCGFYISNSINNWKGT